MRLKIAGYILVLSGVLITGAAVCMSWMFYRLTYITVSQNPMSHGIALIMIGFIGIPGFASGIVALLGGIWALRRRGWGLSFAGSILSLVIPPLGLASGIMLVLERKDWSGTARGLTIGIVSFLGFLSVCFWILAQLL